MAIFISFWADIYHVHVKQLFREWAYEHLHVCQSLVYVLASSTLKFDAENWGREKEFEWKRLKGTLNLYGMYCRNISQIREILHNSEGGNVDLILVGSDSGWISSYEEYLFNQAVSPNLTDWCSILFLYKQTYMSAEV